jgi:ribosomal-protein-alanine N-acetyltransferase
MALTFTLRPACAADAPALEEIETESFPDASWKANDFLRYECWVAEHEGVIAGFLVSRATAPPEREILNLAVAPRFRRSGAATLLLQQELKSAANLFLEVRESNQAARNLYKKLGFQEIARRKAYYRNPLESAIVMQLKW